VNWKALLLLIAGHFVTDINTGALPAFLPFIKEALQLSYTVTASIILIFNVTSSVIQPIFGFFSDRWSARWLLPVGPFIASLGLALLGLGSSYVWILFFAALSGIGQASYHPEGFKTISLLSQRKKASAISVFHFGGNLGFALGPIMATLFFTQWGLKGSLVFILPGILMTAVFLFIPHWKVNQGLPQTQGEYFESLTPLRQNFLAMALLLWVVIFRSATRLGLLTFIPFYFISILHQDPMVSGKYLSMFLLAGTVGILIGGPLADRWGYKKTVLCSLILSPVFLYLFFFTSGIWSLVFFSMAGLVLISSNSVTMAMGQSFMPQNLGMASGLMLGLSMGIGGIGTTILGMVADRWGVPFTLQIIFLLPILAFLTFWLIPYPPQRISGRSSPDTKKSSLTGQASFASEVPKP